MAGVFPAVGSTPNNTQNAVTPSVVEGCTPLFYPNNCNPRFDPLSTNAIISELLNAINTFAPYDCNRLDNLKNAILNTACALDEDTTPHGTDYMMGCFDGTGKRALISRVLALAPYVFPTQNSMAGNEWIGVANGPGTSASKIAATVLRDWLLPQAPNIFPSIASGQIQPYFTMGLGVDAATVANGAAKVTVQDFYTKILPIAPAIYPTVGTISGSEWIAACDAAGNAERFPISTLKNWINSGQATSSEFFIVNDVGGIASNGSVNTAVGNITFPYCAMLTSITGMNSVNFGGAFCTTIGDQNYSDTLFTVTGGTLCAMKGNILKPIQAVGSTVTFEARMNGVNFESGGLTSLYTRANVRRGQISALNISV